MQDHHRSLLLVGTNHLTSRWLDLRRYLRKQGQLEFLGDIRQLDVALSMVMTKHPDYLLIDATMDDTDLVQFVRDVYFTSPLSRIAAVGARDTLQRDTLFHLKEQGVRGYLLWEELQVETVALCLTLLGETALLLGHQAVLEVLLALPERRQHPQSHTLVLTVRERRILTHLCEGLTQLDIAQTEAMSVATVERAITTLKDKLGVASTNALCYDAGRLGLVVRE